MYDNDEMLTMDGRNTQFNRRGTQFGFYLV